MGTLGRWCPRRVGPAEPLAAALMDHYTTGRPRRVRATRADGVAFQIETEEYFTLDGELAPLDAIALERCRGRVLDVGAGAGRHALALQHAPGHRAHCSDDFRLSLLADQRDPRRPGPAHDGPGAPMPAPSAL